MLIKIFGISVIIAEIIALIAYIPQYLQLFKLKDSTGISVKAWWLWSLSNTIYLLYSIAIKDVFLIISFIIAVLANLTMIILTYKYRK